MKKLAIITTHPIQYYAPVFQLLAKQCNIKVFYTLGESNIESGYDIGFKKIIVWDTPLLNGYNYRFLQNIAKNPGTHHYKGIDNPTLISEIEDFKPNVILVYGWANKSHLRAIRYFSGKTPVWFRGDSTLLDEEKELKKQIRHLFLKWLYKHIDQAFYVGEANKAYFEKFGLTTQQLIFAPHAIDNEHFSLSKTIESNLLRASFNISPGEILILFAGKLEPKKDPMLLLQAFIALNLPKVHLLFVGNGDLEKKLKAEKILRQAQDDKLYNIHFLDFQNQSQMPVVYEACDLFCLPSQGPAETWGLAVNEAMAAGKAVLVSDKVGCATDLIKAGVNGDIFEAKNLSDFKAKLQNLLLDKNKLIEMGSKSAAIIRNWSFEEQVKQIVKSLNASH